MKLAYIFFIIACLLFSLVGCSSSADKLSDSNVAKNSENPTNITNSYNTTNAMDNVYDGYGYGISREDNITGHSALSEYYDTNFPNYAENGVPDVNNDYEAFLGDEITT